MTLLAILQGGVISKGDNAVWLPRIKGDFGRFTETKFLHPSVIFTMLPTPYSVLESEFSDLMWLSWDSFQVCICWITTWVSFLPCLLKWCLQIIFQGAYKYISMYIQASQIQMWSSHTWLLSPVFLQTCLQCNPTVSLPVHVANTSNSNQLYCFFFTNKIKGIHI